MHIKRRTCILPKTKDSKRKFTIMHNWCYPSSNTGYFLPSLYLIKQECELIHTRVSRKITRSFRKNYRCFPQTLQSSQEYSNSFPIRRFEPRTEIYPILKTFLFLFIERRFDGVGAPEGRENVTANTGFFLKNHHISPQNLWHEGKAGKQTCDFLADVEG